MPLVIELPGNATSSWIVQDGKLPGGDHGLFAPAGEKPGFSFEHRVCFEGVPDDLVDQHATDPGTEDHRFPTASGYLGIEAPLGPVDYPVRESIQIGQIDLGTGQNDLSNRRGSAFSRIQSHFQAYPFPLASILDQPASVGCEPDLLAESGPPPADRDPLLSGKNSADQPLQQHPAPPAIQRFPATAPT